MCLQFLDFFDIFLANQVAVLSRDVLGQMSLSQDFGCCSCPRTKGEQDKETILSRNKGTGGPLLDCPGTFHPLETLNLTE